jgi:hypothetical protein
LRERVVTERCEPVRFCQAQLFVARLQHAQRVEAREQAGWRERCICEAPLDRTRAILTDERDAPGGQVRFDL